MNRRDRDVRWGAAWVILCLALTAGCAKSQSDGAPAQEAASDRSTSADVQSPPAAEEQARAAAAAGPEVELLPPGREPVRVEVEVVQRPADRQRGLMYRKHLAPNGGMLFLFDAPRQQSFWMRNTYIPLDMLFIRADRTVLGVVENAEPLTDTPRRVEGNSQYVLEVNAGFARKYGIGPGTRVRFIDLPASP